MLLAWPGNAGYLRAAMSDAEIAWLERCRATPREALPETLRHNLPEWLAERMQRQLGEEFWPLVESIGRPAPLDLRVNAAKAGATRPWPGCAAAGIAAAPTPYSPLGMRVEGKPALHKLALSSEGGDRGAGRGQPAAGAAHRREARRDGGRLLRRRRRQDARARRADAQHRPAYAFDVSGHRLAALKPRLARSGLSNVYPVQIAHERDERVKRLAGKVDRVLVDAPCTGLGTLRRNPDLKWRQTPEALAELGEQQRAILAAAARLLKPGGRLVYATCSPLLERGRGGRARRSTRARPAASFARLPVPSCCSGPRLPIRRRWSAGRSCACGPTGTATDGFFAAAWERLSGLIQVKPARYGGDIRRLARVCEGPVE